MQRCLQLAHNGLGRTYPNPLVGSVVVHKDTIIGEGWHQKAGEAHAEVHAIGSVRNKELLKESTLYVSLEPCNHFGRTPPCTELILQMGIPRVVVGCTDSHAKVAGTGIRTLREAGVEVILGVMEQECLALNKRFFTFHTKSRPYIILKWAQSTDGLMAPLSRTPLRFSCLQTLQKVHQWRTQEQAILVGKNTALWDNPLLTSRHFVGKNPLRVLIDKNAQVPRDYHIFNGEAPTAVFTQYPERFSPHFQAFGIDFSSSLSEQISRVLFSLGVQSVLVEGGSVTLQQFVDAGIWDEARVLTSAVFLGEGLPAPVLGLAHSAETICGTDTITIYENTTAL